MADTNRIIELLTILVSEPTPSQGFELPKNEFERHQQRRHEALCILSQHQGNPAIFQMYAEINAEMPPDGGSRDENIRAAQKLAAILLPAFQRAQAKEAGVTNHQKFLREAANYDPFLEGSNLTRDAYAGRGEVERDSWADGVNLKRRR
jgi:hypothetical protein